MRKVLVLKGDGINSELELARAFELEGAKVELIHVNEFLKKPQILHKFQLFALPGGFSFGDEVKSGKVLAEKMKSIMNESLTQFIKSDGRIIGICNGFQVLAQLGIFEKNPATRTFTLTENSFGQFQNKWVKLNIDSKANKSSPWFKNLEGDLFLPMRHKEGKIIFKGNVENFYSPLVYTEDVNGSYENWAALLDCTGQIFGIMPHPEVANFSFLHPFKDKVEENVKKVRAIFKNGLS